MVSYITDKDLSG